MRPQAGRQGVPIRALNLKPDLIHQRIISFFLTGRVCVNKNKTVINNKPLNPFEKLGINPNILKAIEALGFETPTPVQEATIPLLLEAKSDMISLASTGTGKTAAFGLPLLQQLDFGKRSTQALILCPTRELCLQITKDLKNFSKFLPEIKTVAVYGGAPITTQMRELRAGAHIIVATPGRFMDLLNRRVADVKNVDFVILDEADEMLNMGFQEDIETILKQTNESKNTWLFSATMPTQIRRIASKYMNNPREVSIGNKDTTNLNISHEYYVTKSKEKYQTLKRIADFNTDIFAIVFARTKADTQELAELMARDGYNADSLHGDLTQAQRDKVMEKFRKKQLQILIATDVAARGIDVQDITHIIHYSLPDDNEVYIHRSGRTARAGKTGISIAIINSKELNRIRMIEKVCKVSFAKKLIPSGEEVCGHQLLHIVQNVHNVKVNEKELSKYLPQIMEELKDLDRDELIKRFASIEFNRFLNQYVHAPDLNYEGGSEREYNRFEGDSDMTELFISLGDIEGLDRNNFMRFLKQFDLQEVKVGRINVKKTHTYFHVENDKVEQVLAALSGQSVNGRKIRMEVTNSRGERENKMKDDRRSRGGFQRERKPFRRGR